MMAGYDHLDGFIAEGMGYGHGDDFLRLGPVKIVLTATTGALHPQPEELAQMVVRAHAAGFPVAIHAVEAEAVEAAARAIAAARRLRPIPFADRIEHCSECPPDVLRQVRRAGVAVSTQPAFVHHRGDKYLAEVASEIQPWLYAMRSLLDAGVPTAAGSDAPVVDPNPMVGVGAAVTRASRNGRLVAPGQAVTPIEALSAYTLWAARASGLGRVYGVDRGRQAGGLRAAGRRPHRRRPGGHTPHQGESGVLGACWGTVGAGFKPARWPGPMRHPSRAGYKPAPTGDRAVLYARMAIT